MTLVDANVVLSLFVEDRPEHTKLALDAVREARANAAPLTVSESVLVEVCWVLERSYERDRAEMAADLREMFAETAIVAWDPSLAEDSLSLVSRKPTLSITDALLVCRARRTGAGVITFDRGLKRALQ